MVVERWSILADILKFKKKGGGKDTTTPKKPLKGLTYQRTKEEILQDELKYDKDFNEFTYFGVIRSVKMLNKEPLYVDSYKTSIKSGCESRFYNYSWELMMLEIPITFNRVKLHKKKLDKLLKSLKAVQFHSQNISNMMNDLLNQSKNASEKHHVGISANMREESLKLISDKYIPISQDAETLFNIIKDDEKANKATKPPIVKSIVYLVLVIKEIRKTVLTKLNRFEFTRDIINQIDWLKDVSNSSIQEAIKVSEKKSFQFQDLMNIQFKKECECKDWKAIRKCRCNEKVYLKKRDKVLIY